MFSRSIVFVWVSILALPAIFMMGCQKTVFVTDGVYDGVLVGLIGADAICNTEAYNAGLPGAFKFKAWLSVQGNGPDTRFLKATAPYVLVDGTQIASDWNDLTDSQLDHPINLTPTGGTPLDNRVWTGTTADGKPLDTGTILEDMCNNWTVFGLTGCTGDSTNINAAWSCVDLTD